MRANEIPSGKLAPRGAALPRLPALVLLTVFASSCGGGYLGQNSNGGPILTAVYVNSLGLPSIAVGGTVQLQAGGTYSPTPSQSKDLTNTATWQTSNAAIATVNRGVVTGTGVGSVIISATFGGKTGATPVVVGLTSTIVISPAGPFSKAATPEVFFIATATYSDGTVLDVTNYANWDSVPAGILTFYPYIGGDATLVGTGTATTTATLSTGEVGTQTTIVNP